MDASRPLIPMHLADLADPPPDRPAPVFDVFLAASSLDASTVTRFQERADRFSPSRPTIHALAEPAAPVRLGRPRARTDRVLADRRSEREFGDRVLSQKDLERLLGALSSSDDAPGRRTWASAGGLAAVQVHVVCRNVDGRFGGAVHRYRFEEHALARVADVPSDDRLHRLFSITGDLPAAFVVLGLLVEESLVKYGERGGRFALMEVGAAAQTLSLRLADVGLRGYLLGGVLDDEVTVAVGATGTAYRPMLALAVAR